MVFCMCATQVYGITKTLTLMHGILYMYHTSLWNHQNINFNAWYSVHVLHKFMRPPKA